MEIKVWMHQWTGLTGWSMILEIFRKEQMEDFLIKIWTIYSNMALLRKQRFYKILYLTRLI